MSLPSIQIEGIPNSQPVNTAVTSGGNGSVRPANSTLQPETRNPQPESAFIIRKDYPGLDSVLQEMKRLVKEHKGNPTIRDKAVAVTSGIEKDRRTGLPNRRDYNNIALAVYEWMKKNIEYVRDPDGIEWLQTPEKTLDNGYGDCDDQSILAGALLSSIGVPTRFKVVKADPQDRSRYSHVYLEYQANGSWKPFDPTLHSKAGDGLNDSQIYGSRTVGLSDGLASCSSCSSEGLSDIIPGANWNLIGIILLGSAFGLAYLKKQRAT